MQMLERTIGLPRGKISAAGLARSYYANYAKMAVPPKNGSAYGKNRLDGLT